jgi:class 3 adenylate cyclase
VIATDTCVNITYSHRGRPYACRINLSVRADLSADPVEPATEVCRSCNAVPDEDARFCDGCGAPLAASGDPAEYKQVTVLFADVVRSMEMAAKLDIERLREIMTELVDRSAAVVRRYGGTVDKFTGDGIMALFGAPKALEDHAIRACLAALEIQHEAVGLAVEVEHRDGIALQMRVGLNSGQVIAGEIGSGALGYTAVGEQVGLAQRMESVATPGGVMLSESTAALVEHAAVLSDRELVHIKGTDVPVPARRLLDMRPGHGVLTRQEASLVGRRWEMAALEALVDRTIGGRGGVVSVMGPPGIGKSRVAREAAALAAARGADVYWTYCESHTSDIPFTVVTRLLRTSSGVIDLSSDAARARVREQVPDADPQDLLLLDDLLGIADPEVPLRQIDSDARRRRLTALLNSVTLARTEPVLYIIEDAHWIDRASESMLGDLLAVMPRTPSMVLITYRPEYDGALTQMPAAQTMSLAPLDDSNTAVLIGELLGSDPSVNELAQMIAARAAGNPFFAEEMVRELVQRGVLTGEHGDYVCRVGVTELSVPATVQAAIEARIDRLAAPAKRTLNAASVIGARFGGDMLAALGIDPIFDELLSVEMIDQVRFTPNAEYAFRHPLIRAVAYESQLKSGRAELHRRVAAAIESRNPALADENAALIAEHLETAADLHAAYGWHMRAGAWSTNRDLAAAVVSWERACELADALPADDPDQLSMRIAPRKMLCATVLQTREIQKTRSRFTELRELCAATGDRVSLAIGMSGPGTELCYAGRHREAARLASEQMALLGSIEDPTPMMGLAPVAFVNWGSVGEFGKILRWSQIIVDLAGGDPTKGAGFGVGSPLAIALAYRGTARWWLGRPGWRQDLRESVAMAERSNPETLAGAIAWAYGFAIQYGVLRADDSVVRRCEDALRTAQRASTDRAVGLTRYALAVGLLNRDTVADRQRGLELMTQTRELWLRKRAFFLIPVDDLWAARETARCGDRDAAIPVMHRAVDELHKNENFFYGVWGSGILVQTLLERGAEGDLDDAQEAIERLTVQWVDDGSAMRELMLLRLHTLLAWARGDGVAYPDLLSRYQAMAKSLGFEAHISWAEAMSEGRD